MTLIPTAIGFSQFNGPALHSFSRHSPQLLTTFTTALPAFVIKPLTGWLFTPHPRVAKLDPVRFEIEVETVIWEHVRGSGLHDVQLVAGSGEIERLGHVAVAPDAGCEALTRETVFPDLDVERDDQVFLAFGRVGGARCG